MSDRPELIVIGGGLAGCEAAWQAAERGTSVVLYEMRPTVSTGAHTRADLAELVCSNSLGSLQADRAPGVLKNELERLGSLILACARQTAVPAGSALAVDREAFASLVTKKITQHPRIRVVRQEITAIPEQPTIIATGPLTSPRLAQAIQALTGQDHFYFYDAIAPIVHLDSVNLAVAYRASRYDPTNESGTGDYLNCPMSHAQYDAFIAALIHAERIELHEFELDLEKGVRAGDQRFFEGCLPVEILAQRGQNALAYGPLRPVGLYDIRSGQRPFAVVQLRQDNLSGSLYNLVGFQTNLKFNEQKRVFRMIPGLEQAEFERFGQMHRNTYIYSPAYLRPSLQTQSRSDLFFAGQITGVEGYLGNAATGWLAGVNAVRVLSKLPAVELPVTTMIGALCHYITHASPADFQPMKAIFGILPPLPGIIHGKRARGAEYARRAHQDLDIFLQTLPGDLCSVAQTLE